MRDQLLGARLLAAVRRFDTACDYSNRDAMTVLLDVYALHLGPVDGLGDAVWLQHDTRVAALKARLEEGFRARLDDSPDDDVATTRAPAEVFRHIARADLVPSIYDWLAAEAELEQLIEFIALEGGPDADFDDLVAVCQVGLKGRAKLTLAVNYWDEMGRGALAGVHTGLHHRMATALELRTVPVEEMPLEALERKVLNGYLATNRALQPELLGSLGLIECQAGPRCRRVVAAMQRVGAPADALPFYEEHAEADPRHGKEWVDHAIVPLVEQQPDWAPRILRGAQWRALVNRRFFEAVSKQFGLAIAHAT